MGNSTANSDNKSSTKVKSIKQRKKRWINVGTKRKLQHKKNDNTTRGNKPERRKIKNISRQGKTLQTKQDISKQGEKMLPTSKGRWHVDITTT